MTDTRLRITLAAVLFLAGCSKSHTNTPDSGGAGEDAGVRSAVDAGVISIGHDGGTTVVADSGGLMSGADSGAGIVLPPIDAGDPFGDAGPLGDPAWVSIDVLYDGSMCPPFTPCGGDVVGTWDISGGCVSLPLGALMRCPGAMVTSSSGRARGRVTFDGTTATRIGQVDVEVQAFVPATCAGFVGGCDALQSLLQSNGVPDSACVTEASGDCQCAVREVTTLDQTGPYSIMNNEIMSSTGKSWAYCIMGSGMRYQDVSTSGPREPGILDLTQR